MRLEGKWNVCYIIFETESIPRFMYFKRRFSYPVFVWNDLRIAAAKTSIKLRWRHRMTPISFCAVLLAPKSTDNDYPLDSWATLNRFPPVSLFTQLYASLWWWIYLRQNIIVILVVSEWTATGISSQQVSDGSECTFTVMAKVKKWQGATCPSVPTLHNLRLESMFLNGLGVALSSSLTVSHNNFLYLLEILLPSHPPPLDCTPECRLSSFNAFCSPHIVQEIYEITWLLWNAGVKRQHCWLERLYNSGN